MKRIIISLILSFIFFFSFSQRWKPTLGLEGGMGGGGMTALLKTSNSMILDNSELKKGFAYSGGAFLQIMRPSFGFELKVDYSSYVAEAESFSTPEKISLRYLSVPLVFKVRLSTKEGYSSGSWTDESYSLVGNTLYHSPSQYSAGVEFTVNMLSFDFSYQKGMKTIDPVSENYINAFMVKVKFRIL